MSGRINWTHERVVRLLQLLLEGKTFVQAEAEIGVNAQAARQFYGRFCARHGIKGRLALGVWYAQHHLTEEERKECMAVDFTVESVRQYAGWNQTTARLLQSSLHLVLQGEITTLCELADAASLSRQALCRRLSRTASAGRSAEWVFMAYYVQQEERLGMRKSA